ncbi:MAG: SPOR domain-containing protein [Mailhella sp.]|nr:SPOR domain-containing protein [Mailhella sp.]
MANAFYRNTSSSGKKNGDRERRQSASAASEEVMEQTADTSSEAVPRKRNRGEHEEVECAEQGGFVWTARITPSALVTASVLSLVLLGFSFLSGVIVGRGTMPLPQALELERLLAEETTKKTEEGRILQKEELHFLTSLKSEDSEGVLSDAPNAKAVKAQPSAKSETARKKQEKKAVPKTAKKEPRQVQHDYVLRVAAFKDAAPAKKLVARLAKDGMNARYILAKNKNGVAWHYVQVLIRGSVAELQVMRRKLDSFGLHDALVVSDKEVREKKESGAR